MNHSASLLPNGKVFIAGGNEGSDSGLRSTLLFDHETNTFTTSGLLVDNPVYYAHYHALSAKCYNLQNGKVLICIPDVGIEIYDPSTELVQFISDIIIRNAVVLSSGNLLADTDHGIAIYVP
jgi:hypothetical protein